LFVVVPPVVLRVLVPPLLPGVFVSPPVLAGGVVVRSFLPGPEAPGCPPPVGAFWTGAGFAEFEFFFLSFLSSFCKAAVDPNSSATIARATHPRKAVLRVQKLFMTSPLQLAGALLLQIFVISNFAQSKRIVKKQTASPCLVYPAAPGGPALLV
jgi:hypothetical protein